MAIVIKVVPSLQLLYQLMSRASLVYEAQVMETHPNTALKNQLEEFIPIYNTACKQFRYALRLVITASKDAEAGSSRPPPGDDVEKTVRRLLQKPRDECQDARRHIVQVRRAMDALKPVLVQNNQDPKVARQLDTAHVYFVAHIDAALKQLDGLEKTIRTRQAEGTQPDAKAAQELARLQAQSRSLQNGLQAVERICQAQQAAADKARVDRDAKALVAARAAVDKPLSLWRGPFSSHWADINALRSRNGADKGLSAEADKLLDAAQAMAKSLLRLDRGKDALRMKLVALDYAKWLKVLKLDDSDRPKQLIADFESATRDAPDSTWARAFDRIIAASRIPKARGAQWLDTLRRAQLVPTFE